MTPTEGLRFNVLKSSKEPFQFSLYVFRDHKVAQNKWVVKIL